MEELCHLNREESLFWAQTAHSENSTEAHVEGLGVLFKNFK